MTVRISFVRKLVIVLRVLMNNEAANTVTSKKKTITEILTQIRIIIPY